MHVVLFRVIGWILWHNLQACFDLVMQRPSFLVPFHICSWLLRVFFFTPIE